MLANDSYIEVNDTGAGEVDAYGVDREPEEEILSRDTGDMGDVSVGNGAGDGAVVVEVGVVGIQFGKA